MHAGGDAIATPQMLAAWMRQQRLLHRGEHVHARDHHAALELRNALRAFLLHPPQRRANASEAARRLSDASRTFPLTLGVSDHGMVALSPAPCASTLGGVLAQLAGLALTGRLARVKACASEECRWIFLDRSKPANRHWCSSSRCGNRQKTRAYRARQRQLL
jgi:predicted RNA-binding Zn ribbon-like protein